LVGKKRRGSRCALLAVPFAGEELNKESRVNPLKPANASGSAPAVTRPTHISVTFKIVTPDQKRRITFTLSRLSDSQNDSWSVMFQLDERADTTQDFQLVIQLQVDVDHNDNAKAAATAKNGMDSDQHAQVLVAGDTAKDAKNGDATLDDAKQDAAAVISVRSDDSPA
jgi:hypothetical protein